MSNNSKYQSAKKIVVAIPVAPPSSVRKLGANPIVSEVICLEAPQNFRAMGQFYDEFYQVTYQEVIQLLEETNAPEKSNP